MLRKSRFPDETGRKPYGNMIFTQVEQPLLLFRIKLVTSWYRIPPDWSIPTHPCIHNDIERMSMYQVISGQVPYVQPSGANQKCS